MPTRRSFLHATSTTLESLARSFDFAWSAAASLWSTSYALDGFLRFHPMATNEDIEARFVTGTPYKMKGGNLRSFLVPDAKKNIDSDLAALLLMSTCSLFEGWISAAVAEIAPNLSDKDRDGIEKGLQFPTTIRKGIASGVSVYLPLAVGEISNDMMDTFCAALSEKDKYAKMNVEQHLVAYRAFKEARNALVHRGGIANKKTENAIAEYQQRVPDAASLGVKRRPSIRPTQDGQKVHVTVEDVVGFSDVVIRLITTYDAELSSSVRAEHLLAKRVLARYPLGLSSERGRDLSDRKLIGLLHEANLPTPKHMSKVRNLLKRLDVMK